jgi:LysR family transcriptional regulator, nitrogen assimilation regulatory protein
LCNDSQAIPAFGAVLTASLVVATSTQRPVTKAAKALVGFVRKQVDTLVAEGRWAPRT